MIIVSFHKKKTSSDFCQEINNSLMLLHESTVKGKWVGWVGDNICLYGNCFLSLMTGRIFTPLLSD